MLIQNLFRYWTFQVFAPGTVLREKYEAFKQLLAHDREAHEHLAALEDLYYNGKRVDFEVMSKIYTAYSLSVSGMVDRLLRMCPTGYWSLKAYHKKFDFYVRFMLAPPEFPLGPPFIMELGGPDPLDETMAGGKASVLDRAARELHLPVPQGFVITTRAFHYFMEVNDLRPWINKRLADLDIRDPDCLARTAREIQTAVMEAPLPDQLSADMDAAENRLRRGHESENHDGLRLALRSSGIMEDGQASFAGQYLSLMNVDARDMVNAYKQILSSKYSPSALSYRIRCGIPDHEVPMAVLVLEMLDSQAAGVVYTRDHESKDSQALVIHSSWGLGGLLVDGRVSPDAIRMDRTGRILTREVGAKNEQMILDPHGGIRVVKTPGEKQEDLSLEEPEIHTLHRWALLLEDFFGAPQDMEWSLNRDGLLYLLQTRPLKAGERERGDERQSEPVFHSPVICQDGQTICRGRAAGNVFCIKRLDQLKDIPENAIVAAPFGLPQYVTAIDKMAGIILEAGSTAGHFASVAREFGLAAMVCSQGFEKLETGMTVTLDADRGMVYDGEVRELLSLTSGTAWDKTFEQSLFMDKLRFVIRFSADLNLTDPDSDRFAPDRVRSLHDILRFVHETAVREMFFLGGRRGSRKKGARQLVSGLPMLFYVLDVGRGTESGVTSVPEKQDMVKPEHLVSVPMIALFKGMSHPGICWDEATHFDWDAYDKIVMAGALSLRIHLNSAAMPWSQKPI